MALIRLEKINKKQDYKYVLDYFIKDNLYKDILGDLSLQKVIESVYVDIFKIVDGTEMIGIFLTHPTLNSKLVGFHGGLYNKYRHINTKDMLNQALKLIRKTNIQCKFLTTIDESNIAAIKLIEKSGFKESFEIYSDDLLKKIKVFIEV